MPDDAPAGEPTTSSLISRVVSYSAAVLGGVLIAVASYLTADGDWLAAMSFRGLFSVPMWMVFAVGGALAVLCGLGVVRAARILAARGRANRASGGSA